MFAPKYHFTTKIVNSIATIERLYGQLLSEKLIPSLAVELATENQLLATHYSTSIEGNPLSTLDVTNIILQDQIPVTKSEKEVKNYFSVLNTIFGLALEHEKITTDLTRRLHHELMQDIELKDLGEFRNGSVFVGHRTQTQIVIKHNPPYHTAKEIQSALQELYTWVDTEDEEMHPLMKAGVLHHQFAYIHPFFDGNGRMARILTSYYLLLKNYQVAKYFILDDYYDIDRHMYSDMLHSADTNENTYWLEYFLEGIAFSLQAAIARVNQLKDKTLEKVAGEKKVLVSNREEEVLHIIIQKKAIKTADISTMLSVTRQQAHALLSSLVKKGLLEKFGKTKTSYYKLISK